MTEQQVRELANMIWDRLMNQGNGQVNLYQITIAIMNYLIKEGLVK